MVKAEEMTVKTLAPWGICSLFLIGSASVLLLGRKYADEHTQQSALEIAAKWLIMPLNFVIYAMNGVASRRYPSKDTPRTTTEGGKQDPSMQVHQSILQNTTEQFLNHVAIMLCLSATITAEWKILLPTLSCIWTLARFCFAKGYSDKRNHLLRAYGFGMTHFCTILPFFYCAIKLTSGYDLLPEKIPQII